MTKTKDSTYVSSQNYEIRGIANQYINRKGEALPMATVYFLQSTMAVNGKVKRTSLYNVIELLGYYRKKKN